MKKGQNQSWADIDRDGDLDLLVGGRDNGGGRPNFLFRNDVGNTRRWVGLDLEGDGTNVNRDAIGAQVRLQWEKGTILRTVRSRGTYNLRMGEVSCSVWQRSPARSPFRSFGPMESPPPNGEPSENTTGFNTRTPSSPETP